jgi:tellurite resistance protein
MPRPHTANRPPRRRVRGGSTPAAAAAAPVGRLSVDEAVIAVLLAAMDANRYVSREELARAHHIIWSMRRYRRKSGTRVGQLIDSMRTIIEEHGALPVIAAATRVIPVRLRAAAYAVAADLVLADGRMDAAERRFLQRLAGEFGITPGSAARILDVILVKNSA